MSDPRPPKPATEDGIEPEEAGSVAEGDAEREPDLSVTVSVDDEEGPWLLAPPPGVGLSDASSSLPAGGDLPRPAGGSGAPSASGAEPRSAQIIALAAGRGGAGKSLLTANIAVYLAQMGKRVVAVDADPAGGSLNFMLGASRPARGFDSFLRGRADSLEELAMDTAVAGVRLVAGEAQPFGSLRPKVVSKSVISALRGLAADYVLVDLGPPDSVLCLDLWLTADTSLIVSLTDPASIESTYRFLKSAFLRRLKGERIGEKHLAHLPSTLPAALDIFRTAVASTRPTRDERPGAAAQLTVPSLEPLDAPTARNPGKLSGLGLAIAERMAAFRPRLIVSQTRSTTDTKLGPQMSTAARRRLGHSLDYVGHVEMDETVAAAARRRRPVMAEFPDAKICKNIEKIVRRLLSTEADRVQPVVPPRIEEDQTFYELLETEPGVSDEEVRRAFRLFKEIYATSSPIVSGLYEESELAALHTRAEAAHDILFAPERRRQYDLSLPEADLARAVRRAAQSSRVLPGRLPQLDTDDGERDFPLGTDEITGELLRKVREQRGLELSDIAQRTRISERHLRSIEEERFDELPAAVYVRGFVGQMARILKMDAGRTVESYIRRFHSVNGPGSSTPALKEL